MQRVTQYWRNPNRGYLNGAQSQSLSDDITKYVNLFAKTPTAPGCHHEFFLYFSGHGAWHPAMFVLFDREGSGGGQGVLYDDLFTSLNAFPTDLKHETTVYTMLDNCYSGIASPYAQMNFNVNRRPPHLALQVVSCADAGNTCPGGHGIWDNSATQDFMEDPKTMTTGFDAMVKGGSSRNPLRLRLPDISWNGYFRLDP